MKFNSTLIFLLLIITATGCSNIQQAKIQKIHKNTLTLDSHCDTPIDIFYYDLNPGIRQNFDSTDIQVDFIRMKEGGIDAQFFAAWLGQKERTPEGHSKAVQLTNDIIDAIYHSVEINPELAQIATSPDDAYAINQTGKRAIYIGIENGYALGHDLSKVEKFYNRGVRYITLCHTKNNDLCDSSTDTLEHCGLSEFGEDVVHEMNRLGMMVDLSHASDSTFYDVIKISKAPVLVSHSNARALCDSPRNLTDEMLKTLAENNGVCQVCLYTGYIKITQETMRRDSARQVFFDENPDYWKVSGEAKKKLRKKWEKIEAQHPNAIATVSDLVDHIDHIVEVAGIDHVGIGTDFDGGGKLQDCPDISHMQKITAELYKRGYSVADIEKIWSGNFMRVFKAVENIRAN